VRRHARLVLVNALILAMCLGAGGRLVTAQPVDPHPGQFLVPPRDLSDQVRKSLELAKTSDDAPLCAAKCRDNDRCLAYTAIPVQGVGNNATPICILWKTFRRAWLQPTKNPQVVSGIRTGYVPIVAGPLPVGYDYHETCGGLGMSAPLTLVEARGDPKKVGDRVYTNIFTGKVGDNPQGHTNANTDLILNNTTISGYRQTSTDIVLRFGTAELKLVSDGKIPPTFDGIVVKKGEGGPLPPCTISLVPKPHPR
jgi:hypothetical protein